MGRCRLHTTRDDIVNSNNLVVTEGLASLARGNEVFVMYLQSRSSGCVIQGCRILSVA
jgi:hypothetical protein